MTPEQMKQDKLNRERRRETMTYHEAVHAVQSGVLQMQHVEAQQGKGENESSTGGKHLRTGLNLAMCDHAALVGLLIHKGLFTQEEYIEAIRIAAIDEVETYENKLRSHYNRLITLL